MNSRHSHCVVKTKTSPAVMSSFAGMTSPLAQIQCPAMNNAGEEDFGTPDMLVWVLARPHAANVTNLELEMFYSNAVIAWVSRDARRQHREEAAGERRRCKKKKQILNT